MKHLDPHVVAVGVFDGVHRGHQRIFETAMCRAEERDAAFAVVTFEPHPDAVLGKSPPQPPITPIGEKCELLEEAGAERVEVLHFDRVMARMSPEAFVERYLIEPLGMVHLVAGEDFALGRGRVGDMTYLGELGAKRGFGVEAVPLLEGPDGPVSSSRVRSLLEGGEVRDVTRLLGRPYRIEAQVVSGKGLGRELGFPTANLELLEHRILPGDGVYAAWVTTPDGARRPGALAIGVRPAVGGGPRTVEVFLLDFEGDLRGVALRVEFVAYLREERDYPNLDRLRDAIAADVAQVREILEADASGTAAAERAQNEAAE